VVADALSRHPALGSDYTPPCGFVNAIVASGVLAPPDSPCLPSPSLSAVLRSGVTSGGGESPRACHGKTSSCKVILWTHGSRMLTT
jgi:hypothetical protein